MTAQQPQRNTATPQHPERKILIALLKRQTIWKDRDILIFVKEYEDKCSRVVRPLPILKQCTYLTDNKTECGENQKTCICFDLSNCRKAANKRVIDDECFSARQHPPAPGSRSELIAQTNADSLQAMIDEQCRESAGTATLAAISIIERLTKALYKYEQDVMDFDFPPPSEHRNMMDVAEKVLKSLRSEVQTREPIRKNIISDFGDSLLNEMETVRQNEGDDNERVPFNIILKVVESQLKSLRQSTTAGDEQHE
jgi:hypothetical protein